MMTVDRARTLTPPRDARAPRGTWLYRLFDSRGRLLYIGVTVRTLAERFNGHGRVKAWWPQVQLVSVEWYEENHLALAAERRAIRSESPSLNIRSRSRTKPEPNPNPARASRALHACADQGSGIRDQGSGKWIPLQDQVDNLTVGARPFGFGSRR